MLFNAEHVGFSQDFESLYLLNFPAEQATIKCDISSHRKIPKCSALGAIIHCLNASSSSMSLNVAFTESLMNWDTNMLFSPKQVWRTRAHCSLICKVIILLNIRSGKPCMKCAFCIQSYFKISIQQPPTESASNLLFFRRRMEKCPRDVSSTGIFRWNSATPPLRWPLRPSPTTSTRPATPSSSRGPPPTSSHITPVRREAAQRETHSLPISSTRSKRASVAIRWLLTQYQGLSFSATSKYATHAVWFQIKPNLVSSVAASSLSTEETSLSNTVSSPTEEGGGGSKLASRPPASSRSTSTKCKCL